MKKEETVCSKKKVEMAKKMGGDYKKGTTAGDLMKHKAESLRIRLAK